MIHETIKQELKSRGMSIRRLSSETGIDSSNTSKYLNTGRGISIKYVETICAFLKLKLVKDLNLKNEYIEKNSLPEDHDVYNDFRYAEFLENKLIGEIGVDERCSLCC